MSKREHPKDFDILWICTDCEHRSLYHNDMEEHEKKVDHHNLSEFDLDTGKIIAKYAQ